MKTILITGCSSGFGLEIAKFFLAKGWKVIATMRTPNSELFPQSENLTILPLDVTNQASIDNVVSQISEIDVLVNNAGIAAISPIENTDIDTMRKVFETNTIGPIAVIKAYLPHFRNKKAGVIINVSSSVSLKLFPLLSIYTGSKVALNSITEVMALELEQFNIRSHLILPGAAPETKLGANAQDRLGNGATNAYADFSQKAFTDMLNFQETTKPSDVVEAVWHAANDPSAPMKIAAGADAIKLMPK